MSVAKDFRDFILGGNVVDLTLSVLTGAAFTCVLAAFTKGIITPLFGIPGGVIVGDITFTTNPSIRQHGSIRAA